MLAFVFLDGQPTLGAFSHLPIYIGKPLCPAGIRKPAAPVTQSPCYLIPPSPPICPSLHAPQRLRLPSLPVFTTKPRASKPVSSLLPVIPAYPILTLSRKTLEDA